MAFSRIRGLIRPLALALLLVVIWASLQLHVDYVALTPGPAIDVSTMISVKDAPFHPKGGIYLTTVYSDMDMSVSKLIRYRLDGDALLLPSHDFIPPSMSLEEYSKQISKMMDESKVVAKIAALRYLGYPVSATGEGATVVKLLPGTTAEGILQESDVVVGAEREQIQTATDLINLVRRQKPGTYLSFKVKRGEQILDLTVGTKESDTEPGIAVVGILINTYLFGHNLPVQIEIDSENIGGSSAGLMFALGIVDAIGENGLAKGHKIAGTGTISLDGSIGPIGGVEQKVMGAEQIGADYFLAPAENFEAAKHAARHLQVVSVKTIDEAMAFINSLNPVGSASLGYHLAA